jgi:hypothetical protein
MSTRDAEHRDHRDSRWSNVVVRFELPESVVEEIRDQHGDLDPDAVSDRIVPVPVVDGEAV